MELNSNINPSGLSSQSTRGICIIDYIEFRSKIKVEFSEFVIFEVDTFMNEFDGSVIDENFIVNFYDILTRYLEKTSEDFKNKYSSTKKKIILFYECETFLNWVLPIYFNGNPNIQYYGPGIYNLVYLYMKDKKERTRMIEYLKDINTVIDNNSLIFNFFVKNYYQILYLNGSMTNDKIKEYFQLFDELCEDIINSQIDIKIIDIHLNNNEDEEDDKDNSEILKLTLYDYYIYATDYLVNDFYASLWGYLILKCLNQTELDGIRIPNRSSYQKISFMNIIFENNDNDIREINNDDYYTESFVYYLIELNKTIKTLQYDFNGENYELMNNIIMKEYEFFMNKSLTHEMDIIYFTDKFILDYYYTMVKNIIRHGSKLSDLYIILLDKTHLSDIMKMTYMNLILRCIDEGYFIRNELLNKGENNYILKKFNRTTAKEEVFNEKDWIKMIIDKLSNEFLPKVKDIYCKIMIHYIQDIYPEYKNKTEKSVQCNICLDDTCLKTNLYCVHCRQNYHIMCMNNWIKKSINRSCPICRKNINSTTIPNYQFYFDFYSRIIEFI